MIVSLFEMYAVLVSQNQASEFIFSDFIENCKLKLTTAKHNKNIQR